MCSCVSVSVCETAQLRQGCWAHLPAIKGWVGCRRGQVGCYLTPSSFGESLPPALRSHTHTGGVRTHEHHHHHYHQRSPGCRWTHVHTPPRSITQTPMMRGCSSRPKPTQNQDRSGKTRRSERFGTLARLYIVHL